MARVDAEAFASAAESMIGAPFRLHGRDPRGGVDCIGLVFASLVAIGRRPLAPDGYRLRNLSIDHWRSHAVLSGLATAQAPIQRGDVLLVQPSPMQHHLLIAAGASRVIHAHASLRKVVWQPLSCETIISALWRLVPPTQG